MTRLSILLALALTLSLVGCEGSMMTTHDGASSTDMGDARANPCIGCTSDDCDRDGIDNAREDELGTDRCNPDSDGDGIMDGVEVNAPKICVAGGDTPRPVEVCTTDADCLVGTCVGFDPTNADQDGDGVPDGDEDRNHDGLVGDCKATCLGEGDCGEGQVCAVSPGGALGACTPLLAPECVGSETDPRLTDTDGDGVLDKDEGSNLVCKTDALITPTLRSDTAADWTLALDPAFGATREVNIANAHASEVGVVFEEGVAKVAAFSLSKPGATSALIQDEADEQLMNNLGLSINAVFNRLSFTTYDGFDATRSQRLITSGGKSLDQLRDQLLTALIAHPSDVSVPAAPAIVGPGGSSANDVVLLISTVVRDDRVVILGALGTTADFSNGTQMTAIRMRDVTNATALAKGKKGLAAECDNFLVEALPVSDIVWLMDTSTSVTDNDLPRIFAAADAFITKLQGSGIDYRLGVMRAGCSTSNVNLTGGNFTTDQATFKSRVSVPAGPRDCQYEAPITAGKNLYERTLEPAPAAAAGSMDQALRPGAKMIYVFVTDEEEIPIQEALRDEDDGARYRVQSEVEALPLFQSLTSFYQDKEITAFGMIALDPVCHRKAEPSWAAKAMVEKTGGASWPICVTDNVVLDQALNSLVSAAQGLSSTFILSRVPISSTLKLAIGGVEIPRGSDNGFDYDGPNNAIIFNIPVTSPLFPKLGDTIFVSYRFFEDAPSID
ncbi:MAG: VWA domain-containing protein [Deltaproteobacteria bacterium]|nr:VWA domain-containing protein [Deltaproteobacteria bacterium]